MRTSKRKLQRIYIYINGGARLLTRGVLNFCTRCTPARDGYGGGRCYKSGPVGRVGWQVHATEKQANMVNLHEQTNRNMGQEIMGFRRESEKQRRIIQQLERERDRYINENGNLTLKVIRVRHTESERETERERGGWGGGRGGEGGRERGEGERSFNENGSLT